MKSLYDILANNEEYLREEYESEIMPLKEYEFHMNNIKNKKVSKSQENSESPDKQ